MKKYVKCFCIILVLATVLSCYASATTNSGSLSWGSYGSASCATSAYYDSTIGRGASAMLSPNGLNLLVASMSVKIFNSSGSQLGSTGSIGTVYDVSSVQKCSTSTSSTAAHYAIGYYSATYSSYGNKYTTVRAYY